MINVIKRDGSKQELDLNRFHKVVTWSCEGISGVSASEIELKTQIQFYNNIKTTDIQETLIKAACDLISEETPNYDKVAGNLINYHLRKEVYGRFEPTDLLTHYQTGVDGGWYDAELLTKFDKAEWKKLNGFIDHRRDFDLRYAAMEQMRGKYLVKNRVTNTIHETPQMAYILIAATLFAGEAADKRMGLIEEFYDAISTFEISLPTPVMGGVRTPTRQFSSCVLIETDDSLDSINATSSAIVKYVSQRAGIGIGAGRIRAIGSPIRNGAASHTGVIPYYRHFQTAVKTCSQGGIRGGAATLHYPLWHLEVEDLLVLKNNKGTENNRVRQMDYSVQFNKVMYERLLTGGNITLFSPSDVPGLYDAFFKDNDEFRRLYEAAEANPDIRKKTITAAELFQAFMQERKDTGRIYFMNVDHMNEHGSFIVEEATIFMSNLCQEIGLPTKPLEHIHDEEGEISLCTLAAINMGVIKISDLPRLARLITRALDNLLDYQDYPVKAAYQSTMNRRPLGVGIINLAYWLAKNGLTYQDITKEGLGIIHEWAEAFAYALIDASADLAIERGPCPLWKQTKYGHGLTPIDHYKKDVDGIVDPVYKFDWVALAKKLLETGIRHSTLMAGMPAETSAQISNSTNGFEPPRAYISVKGSKDGVLKQVVPEFRKYKNKYDLLWDQRSPEGYLKIIAVFQKFFDQSISTNTSYNPAHYEGGEIPMSELLKHLILCYKLGIKTGYYNNTYDGAGEHEETKMTPEVAMAVSVLEDEDCDGCKI